MGGLTVTQTLKLGEGKGVLDKVRVRGALQEPFLSFYCMFSVMKEHCFIYAYFTIH